MTYHDENEDEGMIVQPPAGWARQILGFWFDRHDMSHWFGGGAAFDAEVAEQMGAWIAPLRSLPASSFLTDPDTALAATILFDQAPRNLYRGTAEAFATDTLAVAIAHGIVAKGWDQSWDKHRRLFAYLPFEHSEDMDDQRESLRLIAQLDDADLFQYAQKHYDIIEEFGRYPHRNAVLGRQSRPEEAAAIEAGKNW